MAEKCFNEVDPVCGMVLNNCTADFTEEHKGKKYGFCSQKCKDLFHGNSEKYVENPASHTGMPGSREVPEKH